MTNNIHLLATPKSGLSINKVFQSVGRRHVQYFNLAYRRSGTLWEGRYRATVADSERYFLTVMHYIELDPVRAGMVAEPQDYPWSSYRRNALGESGSNADWLTEHEEYFRLELDNTGRQTVYRQLFVHPIPNADMAEIRESSHKGWALGDDRFKSRIESLGQRHATSKGVGRPKKETNRV